MNGEKLLPNCDRKNEINSNRNCATHKTFFSSRKSKRDIMKRLRNRNELRVYAWHSRKIYKTHQSEIKPKDECISSRRKEKKKRKGKTRNDSSIKTGEERKTSLKRIQWPTEKAARKRQQRQRQPANNNYYYANISLETEKSWQLILHFLFCSFAPFLFGLTKEWKNVLLWFLSNDKTEKRKPEKAANKRKRRVREWDCRIDEKRSTMKFGCFFMHFASIKIGSRNQRNNRK